LCSQIDQAVTKTVIENDDDLYDDDDDKVSDHSRRQTDANTRGDNADSGNGMEYSVTVTTPHSSTIKDFSSAPTSVSSSASVSRRSSLSTSQIHVPVDSSNMSNNKDAHHHIHNEITALDEVITQ
jgi:hypothetical protein